MSMIVTFKVLPIFKDKPWIRDHLFPNNFEDQIS